MSNIIISLFFQFSVKTVFAEIVALNKFLYIPADDSPEEESCGFDVLSCNGNAKS